MKKLCQPMNLDGSNQSISALKRKRVEEQAKFYQRIEKQTTNKANQIDKTTSHLAKTERGELHGNTTE